MLPRRLLYITFFIIGVFTPCAFLAQDCLEYPELEGPECVSCVPDGWDLFGGTTPDIIPDDGTWPGGGCTIEDLSGASPGGGNMVMFVSQGAGYQEGMITTISGLDTDQEYGFGLYWEEVMVANCGVFEPGELIVTIDGEEYEFDGAEDWELIEICFTPSQSSIEIEVSINNSGSNVIVVDSPDCDDVTPCCPLQLIVEEEFYEICPGEEFDIIAQIDNDEGGVTIEWESDPPGGTNYLSDIDIVDPTFTFPYDENFDGESYILTVIVEDDNCIKTKEIEVVVLPSEVPEFEIFICEISEENDFPNSSLNFYDGTWTGDFDFEDLVGTTQEYVFTLDPGQENCIQEYTYFITIEPALSLNFEEVGNMFCVLDDNDYTLPDESDEDVEGEWDEDDVNPSELGVGVFTFTFFPYDDEFCAFPYELEVEVFEESILTFEIPDTFCLSDNNFTLPISSLENVFGSWSVSEIDLSAPVTNQTITFESEDVNDCYQNYQHSYTVLNGQAATFNIPLSVCRNDNLLEFDSISNEGLSGFWYPNGFDLDTVPNPSISAFWTPAESSNNCLQQVSLDIAIEESSNPNFSLPTFICSNYGEFSFPQISLNNLEGNWSIPIINTDTLMGASIFSTFNVVDSICSLPYNWELEVIENSDPEFSFPMDLCASQNEFTLPTISDNNIEGNWSIPIVSPEAIDSTTEFVFTPINQDSCKNSKVITFNIANIISPSFDLPDHFCLEDTAFIFPSMSTNGIEGQWLEPQVNISSTDILTFENEFIPLDLECHEGLNISIPLINVYTLNGEAFDPSSCSSADGLINLEFNSDFEYSIDEGTTWQTEGEFLNLNSGNYNVFVRDRLFTTCIEVYEFQLETPSSPIINMLQTENISDCGIFDGTLACFATGENLEYSIDNGSTWQIQNTFDQLQAGSYTVFVRSNQDSNCSTNQDFEIEDIVPITISDVQTNNISDCNASDGVITVLPQTNSLEYSIDNGANWQLENTFTDLSENQYNIVIRLINAPNCTDEQSVIISSPKIPIINDLILEDPSDCEVEDGSIEVLALGIDLEYSIDNGVSWQSDNIFNLLPGGSFQIIVREVGTSNCTVTQEVFLNSLDAPEISDIIINPISNCDLTDGSATIIAEGENLNYSIDNGQSWQESNVFNNIGQGDYDVLVINSLYPNCIANTTFSLASVACPCNDIEVYYDMLPVNCSDVFSGSVNITNVTGLLSSTYMVEWSNGATGDLNDNISEGTYTFTVIYDNDCRFIDTVEIISLDPISFNTDIENVNCNQLGSISLSNITGGFGQRLISIDGINFSTLTSYENLSPGSYSIVVKDNFGCEESVSITILDNTDQNVETIEFDPIEKGESVSLNPEISFMNIDSFFWEINGQLSEFNTVDINFAPEINSKLVLTVFMNDCIEKIVYNIPVFENIRLYIANTFSPFQNDQNSTIFIQSSNDASVQIDQFIIYDRWGNVVFLSENPEINNSESGWDGTKNGKEVESGVYTYLLQYKINGQIINEAGNITLVR